MVNPAISFGANQAQGNPALDAILGKKPKPQPKPVAPKPSPRTIQKILGVDEPKPLPRGVQGPVISDTDLDRQQKLPGFEGVSGPVTLTLELPVSGESVDADFPGVPTKGELQEAADKIDRELSTSKGIVHPDFAFDLNGLNFDLIKLHNAINAKSPVVEKKGGEGVMLKQQALKQAARLLGVSDYRELTNVNSEGYRRLRMMSAPTGITPDTRQAELDQAEITGRDRGILERHPGIGGDNGVETYLRSVGSVLSPSEVMGIIGGDPRSHEEIAKSTISPYGLADLNEGGYRAGADMASYVGGSVLTGGLSGAIQGGMRAGMAPLDSLLGEVGLRSAAEAAPKAIGNHFTDAVLMNAGQVVPGIATGARDIAETTGKPYGEALKQSAGETLQGLANQFDPTTIFDSSKPMGERVGAALNLGLLAFGKGIEHFGGRPPTVEDTRNLYLSTMKELAGKAGAEDVVSHLKTTEGQQEFVDQAKTIGTGPKRVDTVDQAKGVREQLVTEPSPSQPNSVIQRGALEAILGGQQRAVESATSPRQAFNPETRLPGDSPAARALEDAYLMHPEKFDPWGPDYDQALHAAFYRHQNGRAPESQYDLRQDFIDHSQDHVEDVQSRMYGQDTAGSTHEELEQKLKFIRELVTGAHGKGGVGEYRRVWRDRNGDWKADHRGTTTFIGLSEMPEDIQHAVRNYVEEHGDSDVSYVPDRAYHEWKGAGSPNGMPGFRPLTRIELLTKEGGDRVLVPQKLVAEMAKDWGREIKAAKAREKALSAPTNDADLQQAIDHYNGTSFKNLPRGKEVNPLGGRVLEPKFEKPVETAKPFSADKGKRVEDVYTRVLPTGEEELVSVSGPAKAAISGARDQLMRDLQAARTAVDSESGKSTVKSRGFAELAAHQAYNESLVKALDMEGATPYEQVHSTSHDPLVDSRYGSQNTVVTQEELQAILARRKKGGMGGDRRRGAVNLGPDDLADLIKIGVYHFEAGLREFGKWSKQVLEDFGDVAKPQMQALWNHVRQASGKGFDMVDSDELGRKVVEPVAPVKDKPSMIPKGANKWETFKNQLRYYYTDTNIAAEHAVHMLESAKGLEPGELKNTAIDLHMALDRQSRVQQLAKTYVEYGIMDGDGKKIAPSVFDIVDKAEELKVDITDWMRYRAAMRRLELEPRKLPGDPDSFGPRAMREFQIVVDEISRKYDADDIQQLDDLWLKLVDAHLLLKERYGLERPGYADKIREENAFYWPLIEQKSPKDMAMNILSPERGASPLDEVKRAKGRQTEYIDGLSGMAQLIERTVRVGEKNQALVPFFDEASQEPLMEHVLRLATPEEIEEYMAGPSKSSVVKLRQYGHDVHYAVDPLVWQAIRNYDPVVFNGFQKFMQGLATVYKGGTTTSNPVFRLVHNPILDMGSAMINHGLSPIAALKGIREAAKTTKSPIYRQWIADLGSQNGKKFRDFEFDMALYDKGIHDPRLAKMSEAAFNVKEVGRKSWDWLQKIGEIGEEGVRLGQYMSELGKGKTRLEASQASVDLMNFGKSGKAGKWLSGNGVPYASIPGQAFQQMAIGFRKNPAKWAARVLFLATLPKMMEQWAYGNDPDYEALPDYMKDKGLVIKRPDGGWFLIPMDNAITAPFIAAPRRFYQYLAGDKSGSAAAVEVGKAALDAYAPKPLTTAGKVSAETAIYAATGNVLDATFGTLKGPWSYGTRDGAEPTEKQKEQADKNFYLFLKQQIANLTGTAGRDATQAAGYFLGKEEHLPNPLGRYSPEPKAVRETTTKKKDGSSPGKMITLDQLLK